LHCTKVPESHGKIGEIFTSGSTGEPVHALRTRLSMFFFDAIVDEIKKGPSGKYHDFISEVKT